MKLILPLLLCTLVITPGAASGKERGERVGKLKEELNLSDEQLKKVRELREQRKENIEKSKGRVQELKKSFNEGMASEKSSKDDLTQRFEAFQKAKADFQRERFSMMMEMRSILNPEQLKKFIEMRKNRKGGGKKGEGYGEF